MAERGVTLDGLAKEAERLEAEGKTPVFVAAGGEARGLIAVADGLEPEAAATVAALRRLGIEVVMLTGDARRTAEAIGREAGIDRVLAEVLPGDKAREIRRLQAGGHLVAMVGDGINDAPALAQADVGIAMGPGSDVAAEAAEVTLLSGDLRAVVTAIDLSRATLRVIRQNLGWAFGYNLVLLPAAAAGLLWPIYAGAAMALSSVSVVSNSLRLRRFRPPRILGLALVAALLGMAVPATAQDRSLRGTVTMPSVVAGTVGHLRVELRDPDGRPASGLGVRAEVFQGMGRRASATLAAEGPGVYTGRLALDGADGVWQGVVRVDAASRPLIADIAFTVRRELEADVAAPPRPLRFRKGGPWTPRPWLDSLVGLGLLGGLLLGAVVVAARPLPAPRPRRALPLPAWLVGIGIAGALAGPLGAYWDVAWHVDAGRDTFWSAPHVLIYGSIVAVVVSVLVAALAGGGRRRGALRHPGLRFTVVAGAVTLAAAPLDEAWHALFGLDVSIWSPPHLVLLFGTAFSMLGLALLHADRLADLRGRLAVVMLAAAALLIANVFVLEFEFVRLERWHVLMARPRGTYALAATTLTVFVLASVARLGGPGAATAAAAVAFALRAGVSLVFLPALGRTAPLLPPLYVVPAVALDVVVALAPAAWSPQRRFAVAGVAATTLAYLTHNPAAALLGGRAVPPDALWAWFPVALLAGAAAAHLGLRIGTAARPAAAS